MPASAKLTILGCGSALPTNKNFPSSFMFDIRDKQFMIDCGEGSQIRLRQMGLKTNRFGHIFISHLHGDHCFGLLGLISTFSLLHRTAELHIHAHPDLEKIMETQMNYFCLGIPFKVIFHSFDPEINALIYEDRSIKVYTIPLKHKIPTCGFLFEEKPRQRHILREMIDFYKIPISKIPKIKQGEDFVTEEGEVVPNEKLTVENIKPVRFAYCSDTMYDENIIPLIHGVDCLYHEATFMEEDAARAKKTFHSTARQAAEIAKKAGVKKLIIGHYSARYTDQSLVLKEALEVFDQAVLGEDMRSYEF
ncbi:MAG TPA: ribonuclease Z [Paludibacteraceae bacterium]|nr:ribonuclease Z [Paludibacteraceae bacterium]